MQCVILAGGLGARMREVSASQPKALIPVCGRPFIDHQLELLAAGGVEQVILSIGYGGAAVQSHVADGGAFGLDVRYVDERDALRGTAGALRLALDQGVLTDAFGVLYGDSYLPIDLQPVWDAFRASGLPALMTVFKNDDRWDRSNVVLAGRRVALYDKHGTHPSPKRRRWIDYGLSVLSAELIDERVPFGSVADLADVYHDLSVEGKLAGLEVDERFYEIGSPAGLAELEGYFAGKE
jgi:NDP-sugar pyrophosphorylase family protein